MATIIEKNFNPSQMIDRTKFMGSPNLFTTSDLNRQMEAFKFQMDSMENFIPVKSDLEITEVKIRQGVLLVVNTSLNYVVAKGCRFNVSGGEVVHSVTSATPTTLYLYLGGTKSEITYADDATHLIAGAKFSDGTSKEAANQIVYSGASLKLSSNPIEESDFICVLAAINRVSLMYELNTNTSGWALSNGTLDKALREAYNKSYVFDSEGLYGLRVRKGAISVYINSFTRNLSSGNTFPMNIGSFSTEAALYVAEKVVAGYKVTASQSKIEFELSSAVIQNSVVGVTIIGNVTIEFDETSGIRFLFWPHTKYFPLSEESPATPNLTPFIVGVDTIPGVITDNVLIIGNSAKAPSFMVIPYPL